MFGFSKKDATPDAVRELLRREHLLKAGGALSGDEAEKPGAPAVRIILIGWLLLALTLGLAALAGAGGGIAFSLPGGGALNGLLFSSAPANDIPGVFLAAGAQAAFLFLVAGILPLCAHVWIRLRDSARGNLYLSFWGTTVGLPFTLLFVKDFFWPLLRDVFEVFL